MTTDPSEHPAFVDLCRCAFEDFGATALLSSRAVPDPSPADALAITHTLGVEGDLRARRLAEEIEGIINEIRTAHYTAEDFRRIASDPPVDAAATMTRVR